MSFKNNHKWAAAALAFLSAWTLSAQVPTRALLIPTAELTDPMVAVNAVRELADGRVVVLDAAGNAMWLANFSTGRRSRIGRIGTGDGQYCHPSALVPLPGDSSAIFDATSYRVSIVDPAGTIRRAVTVPKPFPPPPTPQPTAAWRTPMADTLGHLYLLADAYAWPGDGGPAHLLDSIAVTRWDRHSDRVDTVAFIPPSAAQRQATPPPRRGLPSFTRITASTRIPLFRTDLEWVAAPDGRIALIGPEPYRVTLFGCTDSGRCPPAERPCPPTAAPSFSILHPPRPGIWSGRNSCRRSSDMPRDLRRMGRSGCAPALRVGQHHAARRCGVTHGTWRLSMRTRTKFPTNPTLLNGHRLRNGTHRAMRIGGISCPRRAARSRAKMVRCSPVP